jgi:hypothetical protein
MTLLLARPRPHARGAATGQPVDEAGMSRLQS